MHNPEPNLKPNHKPNPEPNPKRDPELEPKSSPKSPHLGFQNFFRVRNFLIEKFDRGHFERFFHFVENSIRVKKVGNSLFSVESHTQALLKT